MYENYKIIYNISQKLEKCLFFCIHIMLFISLIGFLFILSGFNPYNIKLKEGERVNSLPKIKYYSIDDIEENYKNIEVIEKVIYINQKEFQCLVENIYFEARNQPLNGKRAVAIVTLSRVNNKNFPDSICEVVKQRKNGVCQFSWVCNKKTIINSNKDLNAWHKSIEVAEEAILGKLNGITEGATHFHATYVNPNWAKKLQKIDQIGDHIFYKEI
jgi:spore germination cell wall hydrolase CwlJ-like protein